MEPNLIMQTCIGLLTLAAMGGVMMAIIRFGGKSYPPTWLAMMHGFLATAAVTLLAYAAWTFDLPSLAKMALALFLLAAVGGVTMNLNYHWKLLPLPKWLVGAHAGIAVVGFLLLVRAAFPPHV